MKKLIAALSIAGLVGATGVAIAQDDAPSPREERRAEMQARFAERDADSSGGLSKSEFLAEPEVKFAEADANNDGALTPEELTAFREAEEARRKAERQAKMFARMDADGDGTASLEEFLAGPDNRFDRMDKNDDGELTQEEMKRQMKRFRGRDRG